MYKRNKRPFGSILPARNESEGLRIKIVYYKTSYTFPTGLSDTDHNRGCIRNMLNHIYSQIQDGTFRFAEVFKDADPEKKKYFSRLEEHKFKPRPDEVTVLSYAEEWYEDWSDSFKELDKTSDYESALRRIVAEIGHLTFEQLNTVAVQNFLGGLLVLRGERKGNPASLKRRNHVLSVLRRLWKSANARWRWQLDDPFVSIGQYLAELDQVYKIREASKTPVAELVNCEDDDPDPRKAFLIREWQQVLGHVDSYYRPVTEFMVLTMMIGSEIEALTKKAVSGDVIRVQLKKTKKDIIVPLLKTKVRKRNLPMTKKLREIVTTAIDRTDSNYEFVFAMSDGSPFDYTRYMREVWNPALKAAGVDHRVGYSARHTGIAWSMLLKVDHERLTGLTGHADKGMIYKQYGKYRDGLYEERERILDYLGRDYLLEGELRAFFAAGPPEGPETEAAETKIAAFPVQNFSDNFGDKKRLFADNYLM